jgi:hypothetical protein
VDAQDIVANNVPHVDGRHLQAAAGHQAGSTAAASSASCQHIDFRLASSVIHGAYIHILRLAKQDISTVVMPHTYCLKWWGLES